MTTKAYRLLDKLAPSFRNKVELFLKEVWNEIFITESWRSEVRQKELFAKWLSQVKHSNHQDWLAIDIWFNWAELYPTDMGKWRKVADIAKKYNIDWWYDLWAWDKPHFQDNWLPITPNSKPTMPSKYTEVMNSTLKETGFTPIFSSHEGDQPLTEKETKELIEIAFARMSKLKK